MKICHNNTCIDMDIEEFLEILESELIENLLYTIIELEELGIEGEYKAKIEDCEYEDDEELFSIEMLDDDSILFGYYSETDHQVRRMLHCFDIEDAEDDYI